MYFEGAHIVVSRDRPDAVNLVVSKPLPVKKEPTEPDRRGAHKPMIDSIPDDAFILGPKRATDLGFEGSTEMKPTPDPLPVQPPVMSRQRAEDPIQPPHFSSKLDLSPFAAAVYQKDREKFMDKYTERDRFYTYLKNQSNDEIATFRGNDGSLIVSIRGTVTPGDVGTDRSILAGNPLDTPRFQRNIKTIRNILKTTKVDPNKVILTGSSLGGSIAAAAAVKLVLKAVTFNAGFSPTSIMLDPYARSGRYRDADILNYSTRGDLVSISSALFPMLPRTQLVEQTEFGVPFLAAHKMNNFLNQLGDFKRERGDLYAPGTTTEGSTSSISNWTNIPQHKRTKSDPNKTLYELITGREPPSAVTTVSDIATGFGVISDIRNILGSGTQAPMEPELVYPEPTLDLGPEEPLELAEPIEDILGVGSEILEGAEGVAEFLPLLLVP